jgi:multiple sugar transport system permease protein
MRRHPPPFPSTSAAGIGQNAAVPASILRHLRSTRVLAWLCVAILVAPLWLMAVAAFEAPGVAIGEFRLWPSDFSFASLQQALTLVPMPRGLWNSLLLVLLAVPATIAVASAAAYALVHLTGGAQRRLVLALLLLASIPASALWIPRFVMFEKLGLLGGIAPMLAPALIGGSPVLVLLFYLALRRIPAETLEAARLEGLGEIAIWWRVALPQIVPTTVAVGLLAGVQFWNSFQDALLFLSRESQQTAPLMLRSIELLGATQWSVLMAGALLVTLPAIVVFLALHRFLTRSSGSLL